MAPLTWANVTAGAGASAGKNNKPPQSMATPNMVGRVASPTAPRLVAVPKMGVPRSSQVVAAATSQRAIPLPRMATPVAPLFDVVPPRVAALPQVATPSVSSVAVPISCTATNHQTPSSRVILNTKPVRQAQHRVPAAPGRSWATGPRPSFHQGQRPAPTFQRNMEVFPTLLISAANPHPGESKKVSEALGTAPVPTYSALTKEIWSDRRNELEFKAVVGPASSLSKVPAPQLIGKKKFAPFDLAAHGVTPTAFKAEKPVATEFQKFSELISELRIKIWQFAIFDEERFIEIEPGTNRDGVRADGTMLSMGSHAWRRVSRESFMNYPPLFRTNFESRKEAMAFYERRSFNSFYDDTKSPLEIWYKPTIDILYFNEDCCRNTMLRTFSSAVSQRKTIPRIAFECSGRLNNCCDFDDPTWGVDGGVSVLETLHGFGPKREVSDVVEWKGCPGVKDILFVVKSRLHEYQKGRLDRTVGYRPASANGRTTGQATFKARMEAGVEDLDARSTARESIWGEGQNHWVGEHKPNFQFISLCPKAYGEHGEVMVTMTVEERQLNGFHRRPIVIEIADGIAARTQCEIRAPQKQWPTEISPEIAIIGKPKDVQMAKQMIRKKILEYVPRNRRGGRATEAP